MNVVTFHFSRWISLLAVCNNIQSRSLRKRVEVKECVVAVFKFDNFLFLHKKNTTRKHINFGCTDTIIPFINTKGFTQEFEFDRSVCTAAIYNSGCFKLRLG